ncbi:MAG: hypothetical protein QXM04_00610 [Nanopusillaceae archaeon]
MDISFVSNTVFISILLLASIQDFLKKSVSDSIHYFLIIFAFSITIYNLYIGNLPQNSFLSYLILIFFFLMYLLKFLAIGDLYIMFSLFFFLSNFSFQQIFKFLIMLAVGGSIVHGFEALKIFYRNKEFKNLFFIIFSILSSLIAGIMYLISFSNFLEKYPLFFLSSLLFLVSATILKIYENRLKKELTFERTIDELVEGDWIENELFINEIPENLSKDFEENFFLEKKEKGYIIKLKNPKKEFRFLVFLIFLAPLVFLNVVEMFMISTMFVIFFLTIIHDKIFKDDLGLSRKQIELLKKVFDKNTKFIVKEGAPFVPAITLAYIFSMI